MSEPIDESTATVSTSVGDDGLPIVSVAGVLDLATVDGVQSAIGSILSGPPTSVTFDLQDLSFMDSSGIALLVEVSNRMESVRIVHATPIVRRVLEATGLLRVFGLDS